MQGLSSPTCVEWLFTMHHTRGEPASLVLRPSGGIAHTKGSASEKDSNKNMPGTQDSVYKPHPPPHPRFCLVLSLFVFCLFLKRGEPKRNLTWVILLSSLTNVPYC